ncbi:acyl-CoA carboxylase subunit epsilon [Streptomyces bobili]|uniref:acyl-CoA carboxylase subunit epsilon n=1 Tax=Streptomyces bobili TaxID=67280 RepID=UPI0033BDE21D
MTNADIRVEKGHAGPEEVAAITAILLARAARPSESTPAHRGRLKAGWRRLEREGGFRAPHSWR